MAQTNITDITDLDLIATIETIKSEEDGHTCTEPKCPYCNSSRVYGISRVVGYFSIIDNWNNSKRTELKARQKGDYWSDDI